MRIFPREALKGITIMKKRIFAAAVCATMGLCLTGCGSKDNSAPAVTSTSSKAETISSTPKPSLLEESKPEESSAPPQLAAKEEDYRLLITSYGYEEGEHISITYKGSDENVVYPTQVAGKQISFVDGFSNNIDLKSITIPEGIEHINSGAFYNCINLKSVTIPAGLNNIYSEAFSNCLSLEEVIFLGETPDFPLNSFEGTPWLEKKLSENTDPNFIIIDNVLVKADEGKTEGVVTIPDGITRICNSAFKDCDKVTSVIIPDSVIEIGDSAFEKCVGITDIIIPDSVTEIGYSAFYGCKKLSSIKLSANITEIEDKTFFDCWALESIDIPEGVTTLGSGVFDAFTTSSKTVVNLPDSIIYDAGCGAHTVIFKGKTYEIHSLWGGDRDAYKSAVFRNATDIEFGDRDFIITDNVLNKVNPYATKIELPDNVNTIEDNAFKNCEKELIITYKGKNYNLSNVDKLKADIKGS